MEQNVGEYLQEESRAVPSRYEVDAFRDAVNVLRDDVARFEVRLQRAEAARSASNED
jgi:ubiquinone biosynthesis protein UbiJ